MFCVTTFFEIVTNWVHELARGQESRWQSLDDSEPQSVSETDEMMPGCVLCGHHEETYYDVIQWACVTELEASGNGITHALSEALHM